MARGRKNNKTSIGCLFWIALILLVLVIFLFNRDTIQRVIDETGFMELIRQQDEEKETEIEQIETGGPVTEPEASPSEDIEIVKVPEASETPTETPEDTVIEVKVEQEPPKPVETPETVRKVRRSKLYFVEIHDDGNISLKDIVRPVYYIDSPLTETMNALLEGLSSSELNMGLITLIPEQTQLLSISIKGNTAYMNFSDSFRFNSFGVEGYNAQLKQVVYTATEFSNISSVQILIEGALNEYMGQEGVFIGKPLSRNSF